jgi:hypothetical protein
MAAIVSCSSLGACGGMDGKSGRGRTNQARNGSGGLVVCSLAAPRHLVWHRPERRIILQMLGARSMWSRGWPGRGRPTTVGFARYSGDAVSPDTALHSSRRYWARFTGRGPIVRGRALDTSSDDSSLRRIHSPPHERLTHAGPTPVAASNNSSVAARFSIQTQRSSLASARYWVHMPPRGFEPLSPP